MIMRESREFTVIVGGQFYSRHWDELKATQVSCDSTELIVHSNYTVVHNGILSAIDNGKITTVVLLGISICFQYNRLCVCFLETRIDRMWHWFLLQINNSLKQIRHSASKKQLNRLFEKQENRDAMRAAAKEKAKTEQHYSSTADKGLKSWKFLLHLSILPFKLFVYFLEVVWIIRNWPRSIRICSCIYRHAADAYESSLPGFHNAASRKKTLPLTGYHQMENVNNSASDFNGQDSWSSNVAVVGRGYTADDDDEPVQQISSQKSPPLLSSKRIKETRRPSRGNCCRIFLQIFLLGYSFICF